jgi:hypothetical protein
MFLMNGFASGHDGSVTSLLEVYVEGQVWAMCDYFRGRKDGENGHFAVASTASSSFYLVAKSPCGVLSDHGPTITIATIPLN